MPGIGQKGQLVCHHREEAWLSGRALAWCARGCKFDLMVWYVGLCAPRQHIGLHVPRQHSCILPIELKMIEPRYVPLAYVGGML